MIRNLESPCIYKIFHETLQGQGHDVFPHVDNSMRSLGRGNGERKRGDYANYRESILGDLVLSIAMRCLNIVQRGGVSAWGDSWLPACLNTLIFFDIPNNVMVFHSSNSAFSSVYNITKYGRSQL